MTFIRKAAGKLFRVQLNKYFTFLIDKMEFVGWQHEKFI